MPDESRLRDQARAVAKNGKLPARRPDRVREGSGVGAPCAACGSPITKDEMELEIQFAHDGDNPGLDKYQIHVRCFAAWEFERKSAMGEDVSADTGATKVTPRKRRDMPCEVCGKPIKAGEGHFREGLSWFHPECYERRKTKEHSPRNA